MTAAADREPSRRSDQATGVKGSGAAVAADEEVLAFRGCRFLSGSSFILLGVT